MGPVLNLSIKSIFFDHWKSIRLELSRRYESSHWESIVESVEKMVSCREPSKVWKFLFQIIQGRNDS
jgi:hypothetical protein